MDYNNVHGQLPYTGMGDAFIVIGFALAVVVAGFVIKWLTD